MAELYRACDLDAIINYFSKQSKIIHIYFIKNLSHQVLFN